MDRRLEQLDLNLLLVLHWLLTERNVTSAAGQLGLSQPATSRALGRLRDVFADPLLVKTGGEMVPTPLAEDLRPVVANAVEQCREVLRIPDPFDPSRTRGRFCVACTDDVGALLAKVWHEKVLPEAPGLALDIVAPSYSAARELATGRIDICFIPDQIVEKLPPTIRSDDFVTRPVTKYTFVSAVRTGHPLAGQEISLDDFVALDHVLVAPSGEGPGFVDDALVKIDLKRNVAYRISSFLLALPIVMNTDCVLTGPEFLTRLMPESLVTFPAPVDVPVFELVAVWHPNWTQNSRHRFVREKLIEGMTKAGIANATPL